MIALPHGNLYHPTSYNPFTPPNPSQHSQFQRSTAFGQVNGEGWVFMTLPSFSNLVIVHNSARYRSRVNDNRRVVGSLGSLHLARSSDDYAAVRVYEIEIARRLS